MTFRPDCLARDRSRSPAPLTQEAADAAFDAGKKRVYVTTAAGKTITLDVDGKDTIGTVKAKIQIREGIPIEKQVLSLELEDDQKLDNIAGWYELDMVLSKQRELVPALQLLILESSFDLLKLKSKSNEVAMSIVKFSVIQVPN